MVDSCGYRNFRVGFSPVHRFIWTIAGHVSKEHSLDVDGRPPLFAIPDFRKETKGQNRYMGLGLCDSFSDRMLKYPAKLECYFRS